MKLLIIDEVSMVSNINLAYIHLRLEEIFGSSDWLGSLKLPNPINQNNTPTHYATNIGFSGPDWYTYVEPSHKTLKASFCY